MTALIVIMSIFLVGFLVLIGAVVVTYEEPRRMCFVEGMPTPVNEAQRWAHKPLSNPEGLCKRRGNIVAYLHVCDGRDRYSGFLAGTYTDYRYWTNKRLWHELSITRNCLEYP